MHSSSDGALLVSLMLEKTKVFILSKKTRAGRQESVHFQEIEQTAGWCHRVYNEVSCLFSDPLTTW
eukprot:3160044-Amphidinium_carterae.1